MKRPPARRRFIAGASAALALPGALLAQSPDRPRRVLVLLQTAPERGELVRKPIAEALRARGWAEGRNLLLEMRYARVDGEDVPKVVAESVRAAPDVIMVTGSPLAAALKKTGTAIPCVLVAVWDPIALGLAKSLARPGGTYTGVSNAVPEGFFGKQVELLREAVPGLKRVALLANPSHPIYRRDRERNLKTVRDQGVEAFDVLAATREELEPALREAGQRGAAGLLVYGDPLTVGHRELIGELALRHRLASMFLFELNVTAGGLMSYGSDMLDLQRRGADYVDRILKGAKPADLPIEQPTRFELVINLKTAKALGITIPQSVLLRADRVIE
jgi:putative ABC transport system substrate-binding protein